LTTGATPVETIDVYASANVEWVVSIPDAGAISAEFSTTSPHLYVSTLHGITVYDVSDPHLPVPAGVLPIPIWENEGIDLGERPDGTKFLVVGIDDVATSQLLAIFDVWTPLNSILVIDVTDPTSPTLAGTLQHNSSSHTVSCVNAECTHAYTSGLYDEFSIIDLTDFTAPVEVRRDVTTLVGDIGHDWDRDEQGVMWHVGTHGAAAYDVSDPVNPVPVNSTDLNGDWDYPLLPTDAPRGEWNNYVLHNSLRPNAGRFEDEVLDDEGNVIAYDSGEPALENGNVLLVTEEDYGHKPCDTAGAFETWHVPYLDAGHYLTDNPELQRNGGTITPLDLWTTELLDGSVPAPAVGVFCSAHYFDVHQDGFVAQGWYQQGARILDVRDPTDIQQVGYWFTGASEAWDAKWVPQRDQSGATIVDEFGAVQKSSTVYVLDAHGIDVLDVTLPEGPAEPVRAPILPAWVGANAETVATLESRRSQQWGYACVLP
jgi:hypothetical protein